MYTATKLHFDLSARPLLKGLGLFCMSGSWVQDNPDLINFGVRIRGSLGEESQK